MMWADLPAACGTPGYNHSDNEPGFVATAMKELDQRRGCQDGVHRAEQLLGERVCPHSSLGY